MVEAVKGFLTSEGKFYDSIVDARYHEAVYRLKQAYEGGLYGGELVPEQLLKLLTLHDHVIVEFLLAQRKYLAPDAEEAMPDDPDQKPDTIEV